MDIGVDGLTTAPDSEGAQAIGIPKEDLAQRPAHDIP